MLGKKFSPHFANICLSHTSKLLDKSYNFAVEFILKMEMINPKYLNIHVNCDVFTLYCTWSTSKITEVSFFSPLACNKMHIIYYLPIF